MIIEDLKFRIHPDHATVLDRVYRTEHIVVPDTVEGLPVTGISSKAFAGSGYIRAVDLPDTLRSIRFGAFYHAEKLETIRIPGSVRIIDERAFNGCRSLEAVEIEEGCTHIGRRAFGSCPALEEIVIPASVRFFDRDIFVDSRNVTICAPKGSAAEQYALDHNLRFSALN